MTRPALHPEAVEALLEGAAESGQTVTIVTTFGSAHTGTLTPHPTDPYAWRLVGVNGRVAIESVTVGDVEDVVYE